MKKILLIGSKDSGGKNDVRDMLKSLSSQLEGAELSTVFFEDLLMTVKTGSQQIIDTVSGVDLATADIIICVNWYKGGPKSLYRDLGFAIALYLEKNGVEFWNSEMLKQRSISKVSAMMQLSLLGMSVPTTYFSLDLAKMLQAVSEIPFVFKSSIASRGADNFLCNSIEEAMQHVSSNEPNYFIAQDCIANDADLRVICFGGEPSLVIERRRKSNDTHLNNTSQGAEAVLKELDEIDAKIIEECKKICYNMGREMAGIDVLPVKDKPGEYVYLEVNAVPQLTSGTFVEEKMAAMAQALKKEKGES